MKGKKRIVIDIPEKEHAKIKSEISQRGFSIKDFIIALLEKSLNIKIK